jgi:hypothetical protein
MFCPICKAEYRPSFTVCSDCSVQLVPELSPEREQPKNYREMINLYSPNNEIELAMIKSILDSEKINYFVKNENCGSLEVGPQIALFNRRMIIVQDDQHERASELMADYLNETGRAEDKAEEGYSLFDKIRMAIEVLLFGWLMPGRKSKHGGN